MVEEVGHEADQDHVIEEVVENVIVTERLKIEAEIKSVSRVIRIESRARTKKENIGLIIRQKRVLRNIKIRSGIQKTKIKRGMWIDLRTKTRKKQRILKKKTTKNARIMRKEKANITRLKKKKKSGKRRTKKQRLPRKKIKKREGEVKIEEEVVVIVVVEIVEEVDREVANDLVVNAADRAVEVIAEIINEAKEPEVDLVRDLGHVIEIENDADPALVLEAAVAIENGASCKVKSNELFLKL